MVERLRDAKGLFLCQEKSFDCLLRFRVVADWIDSYTASNTRRNYLRALHVICVSSGLTPPELLGDRDDPRVSPEVKSEIRRIAHEFLKRDRPAMARMVIVAARSFFAAHDKVISFTRKERVVAYRKKAGFQVVPTKEEVYRMADVAKKPRDKALVLSAFQSGVRPSCLLNWTLGLVRKQLYPEVRVPIPLKITRTMDPKIAGYGLDYYWTFINIEAANALKYYLDARTAKGEKLRDDNPIFVTDSSTVKGTKPNLSSYWRIIKRLASRVGIDPKGVWPHCLRKAFRKVLNSGDIDEDTREALMGHRIPGSRENYFDRHDLAEVAEKYMRCNFARALQPREIESLADQLAKLRDENLSRQKEMEELKGRLQEEEEKAKARAIPDEIMTKVLEDNEVQELLLRKLKQLRQSSLQQASKAY